FRTFHEFDPTQRASLAEALAEVRARVWTKLDTKPSDPVILDFDASLVDVHSEKEQAAPTYKKGFGFHPLFVFADLTGETLAAKLRAGNAGSNTVADHVEVFDTALAQLPASVATGHHAGDDPSLVERPVIARADGAGCTTGFLAACRERNVTFFVTAHSNAQITGALYATSDQPDLWRPSRTQKGELHAEASVCEITTYLDLSSMPAGTRCIVRREPLHPGAQRSLFPSHDYRY
ncbi:transposase IS4 family protein, partial [mine drainage metagenome]